MSHGSRPASNASALAQVPVLSPPSSTSRNASPIRKPLHERSNSSTNQFTGPTIRIVEDPGSDPYSKFPLPSHPSQILPPPRHAPGYGFERPERPGSRVSSGSHVANAIAKFEASRTPVPQLPLPRKRAVRHSASTSTSDADTLVASSFSPSSARFSQGTLQSSPPSSPPPELIDFEKDLEVLQEEPTVLSQKSTIRAVPPSSSGGDSLETRSALTPKASEASLTIVVPASSPPFTNVGNLSSVTKTRSSSNIHKHTPSSDSEQDYPVSSSNNENWEPILKATTSTESFAYSDISSTSIEPTFTNSTTNLHEARTATYTSGHRLNYPIVRAPSATSSRATSQNSISIASRMQDRTLAHNWSSQLSTIPSGSERDSRSFIRASHSFRTRSQSQESYAEITQAQWRGPTSHTIHSAQTGSSDNVSEGQTQFSAVPLPLFSPTSRTTFDEKDHEEHLDTISPLPTGVPLRMKTSFGYLRRRNSDSGSSEARPSSSQSDLSTFIHNTIPAWARVYYQRGERSSLGAPESESSGSIRLGTSHSGRTTTPSDLHYPPMIYRPRNRPHNRHSQPDMLSLSDDVGTIDEGVHVMDPNMQPLSNWSTPHLRHDRRGGTAYSAWNAPSLDSDLPRTMFGRQNRQVLLFCVGFVFPLAWIIASFLPLPPAPSLSATASQVDLEQQFARTFGFEDEKSFQKATWWRNLNRIMSGIGTLLIGAIIALAVLASRLS